ncbi:MAG: hypothetical protein AAGC77_01515 [Pseudomonadota bacterium]
MGRPSISSVTMTTDMCDHAHKLLHNPLLKQIELTESFLTVLEDSDIIENSATFSDILRFALSTGLIVQKTLAERLRYANSQVGRWARGEASPQVLVRDRVIEDMRDMLTESLVLLRTQADSANDDQQLGHASS